MARKKVVEEEPVPDDMVARRIVMRRETWDELVRLGVLLSEKTGVPTNGVDVAKVAIEAGLAEVVKTKAPIKLPGAAVLPPSGEREPPHDNGPGERY